MVFDFTAMSTPTIIAIAVGIIVIILAVLFINRIRQKNASPLDEHDDHKKKHEE